MDRDNYRYEDRAIDVGRRNHIRLLGGGILAITMMSGCSKSGSQPYKEQQRQEWMKQDIRYSWLEKAAQAASSHNMQPWLVDLSESGNVILLYADPSRFLPAADPLGRQTFISLGCFLEQLTLAIQADGYSCDETLFPAGDALHLPVARIQVKKAEGMVQVDELFPYIPQRQSNRLVYDKNRPVTVADLQQLLIAGTCKNISASGNIQSQLNRVISSRATQAWQIELGHKASLLETLSVTRIGEKEIEAFRDGIAVKGFLPEVANMLGLFPRDKVPKTDSMAMRQMIEMGEKQAESAAGWIWLTSQGNNRKQQIASGRAFIRLHLKATQLNIALHPMSQALEGEYPEMAFQREKLYQELGVDAATQKIQMLARIGYAKREQNSLRREINDFIINK